MFYHLLREMNYDWDRAREVFLSLDDLKIAWLNEMIEKEKERMPRVPSSGETIRSFDLRGRR